MPSITFWCPRDQSLGVIQTPSVASLIADWHRVPRCLNGELVTTIPLRCSLCTDQALAGGGNSGGAFAVHVRPRLSPGDPVSFDRTFPRPCRKRISPPRRFFDTFHGRLPEDRELRGPEWKISGFLEVRSLQNAAVSELQFCGTRAVMLKFGALTVSPIVDFHQDPL